jgi:murein L,D-transpeptidase YcbB/YkuD
VLLHPKNPTVKNYALSKKHNNKTKKNLATKNWKKIIKKELQVSQFHQSYHPLNKSYSQQSIETPSIRTHRIGLD